MPCYGINDTIQTTDFAKQLVDVASCKLVESQSNMEAIILILILFCFIALVLVIAAAILHKIKK